MRARRLIATSVAVVAASLVGGAAAQTTEPPDSPTAAERRGTEPAAVRARLRAELVRERRRLGRARRTIAGLRRAGAREVTAPTPALRQIAACESGGDPRAVSDHGSSPWGPGLYRGKYQFDAGTWRGVGGRGDPARAAEPEQDYRAWLLLERRGTAPWPVCGAGAT